MTITRVDSLHNDMRKAHEAWRQASTKKREEMQEKYLEAKATYWMVFLDEKERKRKRKNDDQS